MPSPTATWHGRALYTLSCSMPRPRRAPRRVPRRRRGAVPRHEHVPDRKEQNRAAVLPSGRAGHVLQAEKIERAELGFGQITPEMTHKEFVGLLFEKRRNVSETTQQLIAPTLTSPPDLPDRRTGGFTVTIDALSKSATLGTLAADLRRLVPAEIRAGRRLAVSLPEVNAAGSAPATARLPALEWSSNTAQLERMPPRWTPDWTGLRAGAGPPSPRPSTPSRCSKRPAARFHLGTGAYACPTTRPSLRST